MGLSSICLQLGLFLSLCLGLSEKIISRHLHFRQGETPSLIKLTI
jgi:hypothetical protein